MNGIPDNVSRYAAIGTLLIVLCLSLSLMFSKKPRDVFAQQEVTKAEVIAEVNKAQAEIIAQVNNEISELKQEIHELKARIDTLTK